MTVVMGGKWKADNLAFIKKVPKKSFYFVFFWRAIFFSGEPSFGFLYFPGTVPRLTQLTQMTQILAKMQNLSSISFSTGAAADSSVLSLFIFFKIKTFDTVTFIRCSFHDHYYSKSTCWMIVRAVNDLIVLIIP